MIITNKYNLPQQLLNLVQEDYGPPQPGVYRVTSLLNGLRQTQLMRRHGHEITVDLAQMVWALFGKAVHYMLEKEKEADSELKEERLYMEIMDGYALTGQFDLYNYEERKLTDYKTTSMWKIIHENFDDWHKQGNIYTYLLEEYGFPVELVEMIAFLKDHSMSKARYNPEYPQLPLYVYTFDPDTNREQTIDWVGKRFLEIQDVEKLADNKLPVCTKEERWTKRDKYAVKKGKNKRALRVLDSQEDAERWMKDNPQRGGDSIEVRPGEDTRCLDYCFAHQFCDYYTKTYGK